MSEDSLFEVLDQYYAVSRKSLWQKSLFIQMMIIIFGVTAFLLCISTGALSLDADQFGLVLLAIVVVIAYTLVLTVSTLRYNRTLREAKLTLASVCIDRKYDGDYELSYNIDSGKVDIRIGLWHIVFNPTTQEFTLADDTSGILSTDITEVLQIAAQIDVEVLQLQLP